MMRFFVIIITLCISGFTAAQCGPTGVESMPQALILCEGTTDTVNFTPTGVCAGNYEFQVLNSANTVIQPWSTTDYFIQTNVSLDTYFVESRCSTCPGVVVSDTFLIEIIPTSIITADTLVCFGTPSTMSAIEFPNNNMTWWDNDSGGNLLIDSSDYTTPPLFQDDTIYMQVNSSAVLPGSSAGSLLITEAGLHGFPGSASADYLEISNLYNVAVNTTGWTVAISNSYTNINSVNFNIWSLPNSFAPCSMDYKSDVPTQPNYWGNNILWNPNSPGWAAIIDDQNNIVDFVAWGWTNAQLAGFSPIVNGNTLTLGTEWTGVSSSSNCSVVGTVPYSISRNGTSDTNTSTDFVCQATSSGWLNPGISCGWVPAIGSCTQEVIIKIDSLPSGDTPDTTFVACYSDIPAPDISIITNVMDDYTPNPTVTYVGEVSDGNTCPEIITRTYQIADTCNFIEKYHVIVINDTLAPTIVAPPADLTLSCLSAVPTMTSLNWTDNCIGTGATNGIEVSSGTTCPEIITRTWSITDSCGNTATHTQTITINDTLAPIMDTAPADLTLSCPSDVPTMTPLNWTDNCMGNGVINGVEVSSGTTCPEIITRTWTITDSCGNTATQTQTIIVNDTIAPVIDPAPADLSLQCPSNLPPMVALNWADNCSGTGVLNGVETSDGLSCPETITRTWTISDDCGNTSTEVQVIVINDDTPPTASDLPLQQVTVLPPPNVNLVSDAADNCGTPIVEWVSDISDNGFCPEYIVRTYSVTDNCGNIIYVNRTFIVGDSIPAVAFTANPTILDDLSDGTVNFYNQTTGATDYLWDFGDYSPYNYDQNPSHTFDISESTTYEVSLIATSEFGCMDSTKTRITVFRELLYYIPNAFTPDYDEYNPLFKPIFTFGFDPYDYNFKIFNRWGEILFESNNHQVGWDGTYNGKMCKDGTYIYKVEFGLDESTERKTIHGHFSLLK